jgi:hypothetical protein
MNIFVLDTQIEQCASNHCDAHCSKMILETAQLLCTALRVHGVDYGYKSFNPKHPCGLWTAASLSNYLWLRELGVQLSTELCYRYGTVHKSFEVIKEAPKTQPIPDHGLTTFAQAMPDEFKDPDAVKAYRAFYRNDKFNKGIIKYTNREPSDWLFMKFDVVMKKSKVVYTATGHSEKNEFNWK